jgi:hypothetical protein
MTFLLVTLSSHHRDNSTLAAPKPQFAEIAPTSTASSRTRSRALAIIVLIYLSGAITSASIVSPMK